MISRVSRLVRYVVMTVVAIGLVVGIKACSTPMAQQSGSQSAPASSGAAVESVNGKPKININTAILSELDKLEAKLGVPALSHKIQASRPYGNTDELVSKQVISQEQFNQIKDQVTIAETVLTGEAKDVDYMTKLGLMKGHMIVAGELLALNQPKQAEPHLGHPVEEIYVDLEEQLNERQVPAFKETLTRLQDLVKTKPGDPAIQTEFSAGMAAIDRAIAILPETQRQAPDFALQVVNGLLETATAEYTASISDGKVKEAIEYQDAKGFVAYARDRVYKSIAPQVTQKDALVNKTISSQLEQLSKAFPTVEPPQAAVLTADQMAAGVKAIEQAGLPLVTASAS